MPYEFQDKTQYVYAPSVDGLGGIMECCNPLDGFGVAYQPSPLVPSSAGTPVYDMRVSMPDGRNLSGIDTDVYMVWPTGQFAEPMLNGFGAVQDAVSVLSFVDLLSRA